MEAKETLTKRMVHQLMMSCWDSSMGQPRKSQIVWLQAFKPMKLMRLRTKLRVPSDMEMLELFTQAINLSSQLLRNFLLPRKNAKVHG